MALNFDGHNCFEGFWFCFVPLHRWDRSPRRGCCRWVIYLLPRGIRLWQSFPLLCRHSVMEDTGIISQCSKWLLFSQTLYSTGRELKILGKSFLWEPGGLPGNTPHRKCLCKGSYWESSAEPLASVPGKLILTMIFCSGQKRGSGMPQKAPRKITDFQFVKLLAPFKDWSDGFQVFKC